MNPSESSERHGFARTATFATTHWSVVLAAGQDESPQAAEALEKLCRTYWYPLYAYVRRHGYGPEDAQDLTQEFFARLLAKDYLARADPQKGKFRSFLLTGLEALSLRRTGQSAPPQAWRRTKVLSFDERVAEDRYRLEPVDEADAGTALRAQLGGDVAGAGGQSSARGIRQAAGQAELYEQLTEFRLDAPEPRAYAEVAAAIGPERERGQIGHPPAAPAAPPTGA